MSESAGSPTPVQRKRREIIQGLAALAGSGWMPAALAQAAPASMSAVRFTTLSNALAGYAYARDTVAAEMLRALNATVGPATLGRLAALASAAAPDQLDSQLKAAGLDKAAAIVVTALYSGVVVTPKGPVVISYDQALAWRAMPWTKPNAECGGVTDYWTTAPESR
ncbi:MAG: sugar dehydrogenase complex small subunit [Casimicrobiaceae bacterium]